MRGVVRRTSYTSRPVVIPASPDSRILFWDLTFISGVGAKRGSGKKHWDWDTARRPGCVSAKLLEATTACCAQVWVYIAFARLSKSQGSETIGVI